MNFIGQILPVDGFIVQVKNYLPVDYEKSLTHLYQPLIGMQAVMLFQTLLHEADLQHTDEPQTHHTLMNYLNIPLDEIYKARRKLEGIGLLQAYKQSIVSKTVYTYVLHNPFAPQDFFQDAMLSQLLFHQLGDQKFKALKRAYCRKPEEDKGDNVTAAFHDVFETFTPTAEAQPTVLEEQEPQTEEYADFSWIEVALKQRMIPVQRVLTPDNRKLISQMMLLYDLDSYEIEKSLLWALTEENDLNKDEFKAACHDLFKAKHQDGDITLTAKADKPQNQNQGQARKTPQTKEEMLINELETISPKQLLEDLSGGGEASNQDMKVISEVMTRQGLPSPVMNVLIHYVMLQSDMKLSKSYLEKIAGHWSRLNLQSAKEAMAFARKEQGNYRKKKNYNTRYKNQSSKEVIPEWFKERNQTKENESEQANHKQQPVIDLEKEKRELREFLNAASNNN